MFQKEEAISGCHQIADRSGGHKTSSDYKRPPADLVTTRSLQSKMHTKPWRTPCPNSCITSDPKSQESSRLQYAHSCINWYSVLCSYESKVVVFGLMHQQYVWRRQWSMVVARCCSGVVLVHLALETNRTRSERWIWSNVRKSKERTSCLWGGWSWHIIGPFSRKMIPSIPQSWFQKRSWKLLECPSQPPTWLNFETAVIIKNGILC